MPSGAAVTVPTALHPMAGTVRHTSTWLAAAGDPSGLRTVPSIRPVGNRMPLTITVSSTICPSRVSVPATGRFMFAIRNVTSWAVPRGGAARTRKDPIGTPGK